MGVPLEEMDAVFGEGASTVVFLTSSSPTCAPDPDELQEFYENRESEQVSLIGSTDSRRPAIHRPPIPSLLQAAREWLSSVFSQRRYRSAYEPIRGDE